MDDLYFALSMNAQPSESASVTPIPRVRVSNNDILPSKDSSVRPTVITSDVIIPGANYTLNAAYRNICVTTLSISVGFLSLIAQTLSECNTTIYYGFLIADYLIGCSRIDLGTSIQTVHFTDGLLLLSLPRPGHPDIF